MGDPGAARAPYRDHDDRDPFAAHPAHAQQYELPPRLLRARASESGSIFEESVWPPPAPGSRLRDPLAADAAGADDLGSIVDRVMGPPTPPRLRGGAAALASVDSLSLRYAAGSDRGHDRGESLSSQVELLPFGAHTPSPLTLTNPDAHMDDDAPPTPTPNRTWAGRAPTPTKTWLQRSPRDRSSGGGTIAHGHEASFGQAI